MKSALVLVLVLSIATGSYTGLRKKPLCDMCENLIKKVDEVLQQGGDIEKAVDEFCQDDVPTILVDYCEKIISKNLKYIIEKLKKNRWTNSQRRLFYAKSTQLPFVFGEMMSYG